MGFRVVRRRHAAFAVVRCGLKIYDYSVTLRRRNGDSYRLAKRVGSEAADGPKAERKLVGFLWDAKMRIDHDDSVPLEWM